MIKKNKCHLIKLPNILLLIAVFVFVINIAVAFSKEYAGEDYCLGFYVDYDKGFSADNVSSITVNNENWTSNNDRFYANANDGIIWTIVVVAGKNGNDYPFVSTPGGLVVEDPNEAGYPGYGTYTAIPNPDDTDAPNDDYIITVTLKDTWDDKGDMHSDSCGGYGVTITSGAPIVKPSHNVTSKVNITISGPELEYHYDAEHPNEADVTYFKFDINGGTDEERLVPFRFNNAHYEYNDGEAPHNVDSVNTIEAIDYTYPYDDSDYVTFCVNGGGTDEYTSIVINDVEYAEFAPHSKEEHWEAMNGWAQMFCIPNVPYSETYNVVVEGEPTADENRVPGFGWSYLTSDRSEGVTPENEGNFAHGRLEFVSASLEIDKEEVTFDNASDFDDYRYKGTGQIFQWGDGDKNYPEENRRLAWGEAQMPYGTTLTVRIVPDEGYQLTGLTVSENGFQATDTPGEYILTLNRTNLSYDEDQNQFNLNPTFTRVDATATVESEAVSNVTITVAGGDDAFQTGTPKLEVTDAEGLSDDRVSRFEETAEGYIISNYLEISLYNTLYKGGQMNGEDYQSWDTEVKSLQNNATIELVLDEALDGSEVAVVHEVTNNKNEIDHYELIEGTYNAETNTITFETDGFSTYAIAFKGDTPSTDPEQGGDPHPEQHTVTFRDEDNTEINHVLIDHDGYVEDPGEPPAPDENAHFEGWYTERDFKTHFDFAGTPITEDISIYALWSYPDPIEEFEVRFDSIGGDPVDTQHIVKGEYATEPNPVPTREGYLLEGWYLDDEFTQKFDFAKTKITDNVDLMAHWVRDLQNPENYSVEDESGNTIEFKEETGHTFTLTVLDFLSLPKEEAMEIANCTSEEYDEYIGAITNAVKDSGSLIGIYGIDLLDNTTGDHIEDGPLTIRIKLTDEMKKYKTLKLVYVDDGNGFKTQTPITLTVEGDYAVGTLKHLSFYALTGSDEITNNPKTGDNLLSYLILFIISMIGFAGTSFYTKNRNVI